MDLPPFGKDLLLPAKDHPLTIDELASSRLVTGHGSGSATWDTEWRGYLVSMLAILVDQLHMAGITDIFVDGSFVENKDHPSDIDGYFVCGRRQFLTGELERRLTAIDRYKVWTWDTSLRRFDPSTGKLQLPMWHRYRVELYPHIDGNKCGIFDRFNNELEFPAAFRKTKADDRPKGIVQIIR
jgi:hypothetical protein